MASADVWHNSISLPASLEYHTNPTFATNSEAAWRFSAVPRVGVSGVWGAETLTASAALKIERNTGKSASVDRNDPTLSLGWNREFLTGQLGVSASYSRVAILTALMEELETDASIGSKINQTLAGDWRIALSPRSKLSFNTGKTFTRYQGSTATDFTNLNFGTGIAYELTPRAQGSLQLSAVRYQPDVGGETDTLGLTGTTAWKLNETLNSSVHLGYRKSSGVVDNTSVVGGVSFAVSLLLTQLSFDVSRSVFDSGLAAANVSDQARFAAVYDWDALTKAGLVASWRNSRGANNNGSRQLGAWLGRDISPRLSSKLSLDFKQLDGAQGLVDSTMLGVSLVYSDSGL